MRSSSPSPQRYSTVMSRPSTKSDSANPRRKPAITWTYAPGEAIWRNPITGIAACCARAAIGHAAAPPSSVINSRRLIVAPRGSKPHTASSHSRPGLGTGRGGCELRPIVLDWQCRLWGPTTGFKTRKAQYQQMLFRFAPDRSPIELLPPPALGERGHGGLARRLVAVRGRVRYPLRTASPGPLVDKSPPCSFRFKHGSCCLCHSLKGVEQVRPSPRVWLA